MSKYVKQLLTEDIRKRLDGVDGCVIGDVIGMDANTTCAFRKRLREKDIYVLVVRNSLARRATEGTQLAPGFEGLEGTNAVIWGSEDFVSLAKEVEQIRKEKEFEKFETHGGVMDGEPLTPERVEEISKWPNREEQLSILVGQILGPGSQLAAQIVGPGSALASQVKQKAEGGEDE